MENLTGGVIKGYELRERIGAGAFGAVYRAYQPSVRREVAIKIILPHFAAHPDFIRCFEKEAEIVAQLEHPHIIPLYDFWCDPEGAYLVMRFVGGGSLRDALKDGPLDVRRAASIFDQVTSALTLAHRRRVIHRDLKPSNILLDEDGNAYVADFGIAKDLGSPLSRGPWDEMPDTLEYLSPEEARSEPVTPQTDIYSLGVLLYQVLTGQHPFSQATNIERLYKHLNDPLPAITNLAPSICGTVNDVIRIATAKNPAHRYADVLAMATAFRDVAGLHQNQESENTIEALTPREHEVLQLLAEGLTNKEIAQKLGIQTDSVKWYNKQIFPKLHVSNRMQAVVRARALKIVPGQSTGPTGPSIAPPADSCITPNPYKGLLAFQSADSDDFFGREALTEKLVKRLQEKTALMRFLAVIGPSGSGKSSLVNAGLIPGLLRGMLPGSERWYVANMVPGTSPIDQLATTLAKLASNRPDELRAGLNQDRRALLRTVLSILPNDGSQLVLVIDQFEELFTLVDDEKVRFHFMDLIHDAVTDVRSRLYVIVTLRADFYDRPLLYADFGELVHSRMETVLPLTTGELERAIVEPARRAGVFFEPGLVASIISDVNYQPGALPLLQFALTELFDHRQGRTLTRNAYLEIGGAVGALARRVDETYDTLDAAGQEFARQMFLRLVALGDGVEDTRRRVPRSDLLAITKHSDAMDDVIDTFADIRLLSLDHDPVTRRPTVELAHEAILREWRRLRGWLEESRHDIRTERLLAAATEEWLQAQCDVSFVLRGSRLDQFQSWAAEARLALSTKERDFLDASLAERERQTHIERRREAHELELAREAAIAQRQSAIRLRYLVAVLSVFFLITLGLLVIAFNSRNDALFQARIALSRQLAAQAVSELQKPLGNDEFAALLAVRSLKIQYDPVADEALTMAVDRLPLKAFRGHTDEIYSVAFSPNGKSAVTGSADHTAKLWDVMTAEVMAIYNHDDEVHAAVFSPDGQYIVTGCADHMVRLWNTSGQLVRTFTGHSDAVFTVAFSPDGKYILSGGEDLIIRLWDAATGQQVRTLTGHTSLVRTVAFSPDGKLALSSGNDIVVRLWDITTGQQIRTFSGHSESVNSVVFSPDSKSALTGSTDNTARLWDIATGQLLRTFVGHSNSVRSVAFSPDGTVVLTGSGDYTARLWDLATGHPLRTLRGHTNKIWSAAFSPDGKYVLTGSIDLTAKLWDISKAGFRTLNGHTDEVHGVAVSPDGSYILTTSADRTAILWDAKKFQQVRTFTGYPDIIWCGAFSFDGKYVLVAGRGHTAMLWDVASGQQLRTFSGHTNDVYGVAFSPNGKYVVTASLDNTARIWETSTGRLIYTLNHASQVRSAVFSPDGKYVLTGSSENAAWLWDAATGERVRSFKFAGEGDDIIWGLAFSPDGKYALTGSTAQTALLWDTATGQQLRTFSGHKNAIYSAVFSPDGKYILTGSADRTAILWDTATGKQLRTLSGHGSAVWSATFLPDGKYVLTGSFDGTARLWDVDYRDFLATACKQLLRDLTPQEREQVHITDTESTC